MQFPSVIVLVYVSLRCYATCVFKLHATYVWYWPRCRPSVPRRDYLDLVCSPYR